MQDMLFNYPNLDVRAGSVFDLVFSHFDATSDDAHTTKWGTIQGVKLGKDTSTSVHIDTFLLIYILDSGEIIKCSQVVICTGTFLSGEIHIGK